MRGLFIICIKEPQKPKLCSVPLCYLSSILWMLEIAPLSHSSILRPFLPDHAYMPMCSVTAHVYTHMHTFTDTYMHTFTDTHMHTFMDTCIYTCMHVYTHTNILTLHNCILTCMHAYSYTYTHTSSHTYIHAYLLTYIHTCILTYVHTYSYTCIHTCILTCEQVGIMITWASIRDGTSPFRMFRPMRSPRMGRCL